VIISDPEGTEGGSHYQNLEEEIGMQKVPLRRVVTSMDEYTQPEAAHEERPGHQHLCLALLWLFPPLLGLLLAKPSQNPPGAVPCIKRQRGN
jgi:hypothetical protein